MRRAERCHRRAPRHEGPEAADERQKRRARIRKPRTGHERRPRRKTQQETSPPQPRALPLLTLGQLRHGGDVERPPERHAPQDKPGPHREATRPRPHRRRAAEDAHAPAEPHQPESLHPVVEADRPRERHRPQPPGRREVEERAQQQRPQETRQTGDLRRLQGNHTTRNRAVGRRPRIRRRTDDIVVRKAVEVEEERRTARRKRPPHVPARRQHQPDRRPRERVAGRRRQVGQTEKPEPGKNLHIDAPINQVVFIQCEKITPIRVALATAPQNAFAKGNLIHTSRSRK